MAHDVFISHHTKSSLSVTQAVCNSLESKGIRCWYAPRDTEGDYASAIYRAIQEARIFILILNKEASYSEDVLNEINLACQRVRDGDELIILPFHISSEDINGAAKYYLARMHWIDAIEPPMQERIAELIKKVLHLLSEGKTPVTEEETPGKTLLQPSRINCGTGFMGRDEELQQLHETLTAYDRVFMYGIGGIGKSELARQYAKKFSDAYDTIVFATYSSSLREMVTNDTDIVISNFRRAAGETEEEYFGRKMARLNRIADERTLVIVDNFDTDSDPDLEAFASGGFRILFTTRNDHSDTGYPIMHIRELDEEEQYTLFLKNYSRPVRGNDEGDIRAILRMVNGHTLTIELIAKLMQISRRPAKILEEIRSSGLASAMRGTVKHEFSSDTAYQYIHRLFSMSRLSEDEYGIMMNLSLMPMDGVDFVEFAEWCGTEDYGVIDGLIKKSWIIYDNTEDRISLHPLICEVVTRECKPDLQKCAVMFENLVGCISRFKYRDMPYDEVKKYADVLESLYLKNPVIDLSYDWAYHPMLEVFNHTEKADTCRRLVKSCLDAAEAMYGEHSECAARWCYRMSDVSRTYCNDRDGEVYCRKAVEILESCAPDSLDFAYINVHSTVYLRENREFEKMKKAFETSLDVLAHTSETISIIVPGREVLLGDIYHKMAVSYYYQQREYLPALEYAEKSYEIFSRIPDHYAMAWIVYPYMARARIYSMLGERDAAIADAEASIRISKEYYGEYHAQVNRRYMYLAEVYRNLGLEQEELETWKHLRDVLEKKNEEETEFYRTIAAKIENLEN